MKNPQAKEKSSWEDDDSLMLSDDLRQRLDLNQFQNNPQELFVNVTNIQASFKSNISNTTIISGFVRGFKTTNNLIKVRIDCTPTDEGLSFILNSSKITVVEFTRNDNSLSSWDTSDHYDQILMLCRP